LPVDLVHAQDFLFVTLDINIGERPNRAFDLGQIIGQSFMQHRAGAAPVQPPLLLLVEIQHRLLIRPIFDRRAQWCVVQVTH
jgi:hypothetical protein